MSHLFIDTHVHFWDQRVLPYPWLVEVPGIAGPHTPAELQAEASADHPAQMVFVECGAPGLDEVKWITQTSGRRGSGTYTSTFTGGLMTQDAVIMNANEELQ